MWHALSLQPEFAFACVSCFDTLREPTKGVATKIESIFRLKERIWKKSRKYIFIAKTKYTNKPQEIKVQKGRVCWRKSDTVRRFALCLPVSQAYLLSHMWPGVALMLQYFDQQVQRQQLASVHERLNSPNARLTSRHLQPVSNWITPGLHTHFEGKTMLFNLVFVDSVFIHVVPDSSSTMGLKQILQSSAGKQPRCEGVRRSGKTFSAAAMLQVPAASVTHLCLEGEAACQQDDRPVLLHRV